MRQNYSAVKVPTTELEIGGNLPLFSNFSSAQNIGVKTNVKLSFKKWEILHMEMERNNNILAVGTI